MNAYESEERTVNSKTYQIDFVYDSDMGAPWEEHDGHGPVTDWTTRDKHPGELILNKDRNSARFYDFAEACKIALAEGWDSKPYNTDGKQTPRQQAAKAALADFDRLRAWCADEWHWCGVVVTERRTDSDGYTYDGPSESLWGIESDAGDYFETVINELIEQLKTGA